MDTRESYSTQIVCPNGHFNVDAVDRFVRQTPFGTCGTRYAVVSIIGSQSSGKSYLLNCLFETTFGVMDESERTKTTKGIWIGNASGDGHFIVAMDIEGTDGIERGQDDTFEKQSAVFALSVSHVVLINIPLVNVGLEHAAYNTLLGNVMEAMLKLFNQFENLDKTTLMFVIRDKSKRASEENLGRQLRKDIQKIWDNVPKPQALKHTQLSDFFKIDIMTLPHYDDEEQFREKVASLRKRIFDSIPHERAGCSKHGVLHASVFLSSMVYIWKFIKENKDLNLNHKKDKNMKLDIDGWRLADILIKVLSLPVGGGSLLDQLFDFIGSSS